MILARKVLLEAIFGPVRAKTRRKVRIGAIFACKVLLEAIFGPVLGVWGPWNLSTLKSGANLGQIPGQIPGQNLWQSHDSSRRQNPENC